VRRQVPHGWVPEGERRGARRADQQRRHPRSPQHALQKPGL
jgi:hypothetical protein